MRRHGDSIRDLRVRRFSAADFDRFDLILAMDRRNARDLRSLARTDHDLGRIRMFLAFAGGGEIQDPVELGREAFEQAYATMDVASEKIVRYLESRLTEPPSRRERT
jgi:protein-tyrosine phosphatase